MVRGIGKRRRSIWNEGRPFTFSEGYLRVNSGATMQKRDLGRPVHAE